MKLGTQVDLGPGHIVLDGDSAPPRKGAQQPPLSKITGAGFARIRIILGPCLLWPNGWMDQDVIWYGGRHRPRSHCVRWGTSSPSPKGAESPIFGPRLLWPNVCPSPLLLSTCIGLVRKANEIVVEI